MTAPGESALLEAFRSLDSAGREMLLEFARFLRARRAAPDGPVEPVAIARPQSESVVAAIRRLSQTYPMLDATDLLHDASDLVARHVMGTQSAAAVVDELEALFARRYATWRTAGTDAPDGED